MKRKILSWVLTGVISSGMLLTSFASGDAQKSCADALTNKKQAYTQGVIKPQFKNMEKTISDFYEKWKKKYYVYRKDLDMAYVYFNGATKYYDKDGNLVTGLEAFTEYPEVIACSESIAYGMLITVMLGKKSDYDALYRYYQKFKKTPYADNLMGWVQKLD